MKVQKYKNDSIAIGLALLFNALLFGIGVSINKDYGFTVFLFIPFFLGFIPVLVKGRFQYLSTKESFALALKTLGIATFVLLIAALEGVICIVMASPLFLFAAWLGSLLGFYLQKHKIDYDPSKTALFVLIFSALSLSFDHQTVDNMPLTPVTTTVEVHAPIEQVWTNVVTFSELPPPEDWIFKTGISYPIDATIEGQGVGAVRYCNFSTGSFVEPITTWDEPNLLQFDVVEQPIPMNEYNPFWEIHPPHLDGYFLSRKGQFQLTAIDENTTLLEGTTWYELDIHPTMYWGIWADFIVHEIHERVLNHIKTISEKTST